MFASSNGAQMRAVPYKSEPDAMADLAKVLRDHHANKVGPIDVGALDLLADIMEAVGQSKATVLSAFRTPETNAKLASKGLGVAEHSQHLLGKALGSGFRAFLMARTAPMALA